MNEKDTSKKPTGNELLAVGLEHILGLRQFQQALREVSDAAFEAVFKAQDANKLTWRGSFDRLTLETDVVVKNGGGNGVQICVILYKDEMANHWFLVLQSKKDSPSLSNSDERVRRLYEQITGEDIYQGSM